MNKRAYAGSVFFVFIFGISFVQGMELVIQTEEQNDSNRVELSLLDSIKAFMTLSVTCKECNKLFTCKVIGDLCKSYSQRFKDITLNNLINDMCPNLNYTHKRLTVLTLVYAGANVLWGYRLLVRAVENDDLQLVKIILQYNETVDVNTEISPLMPCGPLLFAVKSVGIAEQLIARGANVHGVHPNKQTNILWSMLDNTYPTSLMEFYLTKNIDATQLNPSRKKETLLHRFAATPYSGEISNLDNFMQKAKLLFSIIPDKINALDGKNRSPRDIVEISFESAKRRKNKAAKVAFKALILLFQEQGVFLVKEIAKKKILKLII